MIPSEVKYRDLIGKEVVFDRDYVSQQGLCVSRGTKAKVRFYSKEGYTVETEKCSCCGNWAILKRIKKEDISLAEE